MAPCPECPNTPTDAPRALFTHVHAGAVPSPQAAAPLTPQQIKILSPATILAFIIH